MSKAETSKGENPKPQHVIVEQGDNYDIYDTPTGRYLNEIDAGRVTRVGDGDLFDPTYESPEPQVVPASSEPHTAHKLDLEAPSADKISDIPVKLEFVYSLEEETKILDELSPEKKKLVEETRMALAEQFGLKPEDFQTIVVDDEDGGKKVLVVQSSYKGMEPGDSGRPPIGILGVRTAKIDVFGHMTKGIYGTLIASEKARGTELLPDDINPRNNLHSPGTYLDGEPMREHSRHFNSARVGRDGEPDFESFGGFGSSPGYRAVVDVEQLAKTVELSEKDPEKMPGASPETAILLSPEEYEEYERALDIQKARIDAQWYPNDMEMRRLAGAELPINPRLLQASEQLKEVNEAHTGWRNREVEAVWVRTEEVHNTYDDKWNTWKTCIMDYPADNQYGYGDVTDNRHYTTHPDGSVELTYTWQPIR